MKSQKKDTQGIYKITPFFDLKSLNANKCKMFKKELTDADNHKY